MREKPLTLKVPYKVLMTGWTGLATLEKQGGNQELSRPKTERVIL